MLTCTVENFRGIRWAQFSCSRIALLCGQNEQGKSSIIDGIRAALQSEPKPFGLTKDGMSAELTYDQADFAKVVITTGERTQEGSWPAGEFSTQGAPFRTTGLAIGAIRFSSLSERERMQVLSRYLKTDPTLEELTAALTIHRVPEAQIKAIWSTIQKLGWDGAWESEKTEGTKLKGAWEQITKDRYGSKVGGTWRPKGWSAEHEALSEEKVRADLVVAERELEAAIGKVAINEDERNKLKGLENNIPKLREMLASRDGDQKRAKATLTKAEGDIRKIPILPPENWPTCPHCQKAVQVVGGDQLRIPPAALSAKERKKIEDEAAQATTVLTEAQGLWQEADNLYQTVAKDLNAALKAKESLENSDPAAVSAETIEELREDVKWGKNILHARERIRNAITAHLAVLDKANIVNALAPEGLRKTKLEARLGDFNAALAQYCAEAGWAPVTIDPDGVVRLKGRHYVLCSGSGRMRCDATLQVAFSVLDGSEIILVDEADVLDGKGRNGLLKLLKHTGRYAIVAMMLVRASEAPDLAAAGWGATYWIAGAESKELAAVKAAA